MRYTFMRTASGRAVAVLLLVASLAMSVVGCHRSADAPDGFVSQDPRVGGRLFAATSPFNQVIPVNPQLDPKSAD
ncbi:hypothetical protein ACWEOZ_43310, partial [Actinoplanes sp. NPDC004185]